MKIKFNNFTCIIGNKYLYNQVSNEFIFDKLQLIGINGSGKTTLLKCINGEIKYDGEITLDTKSIVLISQFSILNKNLSITDNLTLYLEDYSEALNIFKKRFPKIKINTKFKKLSGGQAQFLNFLVGYFQDYELLLVDEPFNNLDIESYKIVEQLLVNCNKPLIVVSHNNELDIITDKLYVGDGDISYEEN